MINRTILEWQSIAYGDGSAEIPLWAADRLAAVAKASSLGGAGGARVLAHGRRDLTAGQVVGIIAAENCSLEILPKIDGLGGGAEGEQRIRYRLVHMLAVALDIEIDDGQMASLGWQDQSLLEILIGLFARKLSDAVRLGLPRRYVEYEDDLPALKGRLDVVRQFTVLSASPQALACRYDTLSADIALNQIMKAAVGQLSRLSRAAINQRHLRELTFAYVDIGSVPVAALAWEKVVLDRTNKRWRELVSLAKLLLGQRFQTTTTGKTDGYSLLFEMNTLFEEYIGRLVHEALSPEGYSVKLQGGFLDCLLDLDGDRRGRFRTIPDILVGDKTGTRLIIDTKWKHLTSRVDDPKQGISQSDVYQMMAYATTYRCPQLMLLYPHRALIGGEEGVKSRFQIAQSNSQLSIATIDVGKGRGLRPRLRRLACPMLARSIDKALRGEADEDGTRQGFLMAGSSRSASA